MLSEPITLYKLMILYMLRMAKFPLKNSRISEFFLEHEYTDYFTFQQAINELAEARLITQETMRNTTQNEITREGEEALGYFGKTISDAIKADINEFLKKNRIRLRDEVNVVADYYKAGTSDINVRLEVREGRTTMISINIPVSDEDQAERLCDNWQKDNQRLYAFLMQELLK